MNTEEIVDPVAALKRIAFELERRREATYRMQAYRKAAWVLADLDPEEIALRVQRGTLTDLAQVGPKTAAVAAEAVSGRQPEYLTKLLAEREPLDTGGEAMRAALRGDLHTHSNWTDGGSPPEEMAAAYVQVGHEYAALTDHSPGSPSPVACHPSDCASSWRWSPS